METDTVEEVDRVVLVGIMLVIVDCRASPIEATSSSTTDHITVSEIAPQV